MSEQQIYEEIIAKRNDQIARLHESLSQKASEIETLQKTLKAKGEYIDSLDKSLYDRSLASDRQIAEIRSLREKAALSDLRNAELEGKVKRAEGNSNYWFQECEGLKKVGPRQELSNDQYTILNGMFGNKTETSQEETSGPSIEEQYRDVEKRMRDLARSLFGK